MAAPRRLSIWPDVPLKIEITPTFEGIDHTDSDRPWKFRITNLEEIFDAKQLPSILSKSAAEGVISPTSRVTLSRTIRKIAGIPENATSYAFMHPPQALANILQKSQSRRNLVDLENEDLFVDHSTIFTQDDSDTPDEQEEGIKSAILLGGYAYFDDDFKLLRINALSRTKSPQKLAFSGPFKVHLPAFDELHRCGRTQPMQASHFREAGFESVAWIRPREVIAGDQIFKDHPNWSGAFVFFRENRTGVGYAVDATCYVNPCGDIGVICDALSHIGEANFSNNSIEPLFEISPWKNNISKMKNVDSAKLIEELDDKRTLLHKACHACLGAKFIDDLLSNSNEASNLSYQDGYGWTPLHYACRFSPSDHVLILLLTTVYPDAVLQPDHYNRCPLHIACDSHTSVEVVKILLGAETSTTNDTLYRKTQRFGFLPLHLAIYKGFSKGVIKTLLDADKDGYTVVTKSNCEHLPLHLAILKQLPASSVKMILNAVRKIKDPKYQYGYDCGIYEYFEANIPLHLACWNNSPKEVVQLLLDEDTENITTTLCVEPNDPAISGLSKFDRHFSLDDAPYNWSTTSLGIKNEVETMPLHLAVKHGSIDVIRLLLDKEFSKHCSVASSSLYKTDSRGRTPLHIACEYTTDPLIIQLLVERDTLKKTIQIDDGKGFRPLHYACEVVGTSTEVVKILCEAEERSVQRNQTLKKRIKKETRMKMKMKTRSALSGSRESDRTPLYLALKTGTPTEVVDILLQPENFTLAGIDEISMERLAEIVKKSDSLQEKVIDILAARENFSMLVIEFYADVIALVALLLGTLELANGTVSRVYPSLIFFSCAVFLTRELLQIVSVGADYIADVWSWLEILGIGLLMKVALIMFEKKSDNEEFPSSLLSITGFVLVLAVTSFLRSTFLPFARFVGGLILIVKMMIPFLIVSVLLICAFLYGFFMTKHGNCDTFVECIQIIFQTTFNYSIGTDAGLLDILFGVVIVIILLNVVVAIVGEAWDDAATNSTMFFWKYRLEKICDFQGLDEYRRKFPKFEALESFLMFFEEMIHDGFSSDIPWSSEPYNVVTTKAHYDNPQDFFDPKLAKKILISRSLRADMHFANREAKSSNNGKGLSMKEKILIILRWIGRNILYYVVIIFGILTCGYTFPNGFRYGLLSTGIEKEEEALLNTSNENDQEHGSASESENQTSEEKLEKMENTRTRLELAEYVMLKRNKLLLDGTSTEEIDLAIPIVPMVEGI